MIWGLESAPEHLIRRRSARWQGGNVLIAGSSLQPILDDIQSGNCYYGYLEGKRNTGNTQAMANHWNDCPIEGVVIPKMELYFIDSTIHILTQVSIYPHLTFCGAMASTTSCKSGDLPVGLSGCQIFLFKRVFCSRIMFGSRIAFSRICLNSMGSRIWLMSTAELNAMWHSKPPQGVEQKSPRTPKGNLTRRPGFSGDRSRTRKDL